MRTVALTFFAAGILGIAPGARAQDALFAVVPARVDLTLERVAPAGLQPVYSSDHDAQGRRAWKRSLIAVAASQSLDVISSYGMRERNPLLRSADGRFGPKAASIKLGATAAAVAVEYLLVKKYPKAARIFSKVNWSSSVLTSAFAVHNFAIK